MKKKYAFVAYKTLDLDETIRFYTDVMGFKKKHVSYNEDRSVCSVYFDTPDGRMMELLYAPQEAGLENTENFHVCWNVPEAEHAAQHVAASGRPIHVGPPSLYKELKKPPYKKKERGPCGCFSIHFPDPSGNGIEFHELTEKSLQTKTRDEISEFEALIKSCDYIPEIKLSADSEWRSPAK